MKDNTKIIALAAALAAGVAQAAAAPTANPNGYTTAGSQIQNTASATFTDPSTGTTAAPVSSNTVTTTVLPLPSFDIVYASGANDGGGVSTNPANSVSSSTPDQAPNTLPGATVTDSYYLVNNGNTPLNITLNSSTTGSPNTPSAVTYTLTYKDASGATQTVTAQPSATVYLPVGAVIQFTQNTTIPAAAVVSTSPTYGATPVGTALATDSVNQASNVTSTLYENQIYSTTTSTITGPAAGTDLQYQAITVYAATINNAPDTTPTTAPTSGAGSATPTGGAPSYDATPPSTVTPPPNSGTAPGTTPISISGNQQIAYPPADTNSTPDVVDFTNTLTNSGTLSDTLSLAPTNGTWTKTGTGTWTNSAGDTVQFLNPSTGAPIDSLTVPAGQTANYITQVTYPDSNSVNNPSAINVVITATSGNDSTKTASTTDTIMPPAASFGDTAAVTQAAGVLESPATAYYPGNSTTAVNTAPGTTATYPMSISNAGTYQDSYTLVGAVPIVVLNADGTTTTNVYAVQYTGATISPLYTGNPNAPLSTTQTPGTAPVVINGTTYYAPIYTTSTVAANTSTMSTISATVAVPSNALATSATNPAPSLTQIASSVYSAANGGGLVMQDTNDLLAIGPKGGVVVGKFTQAATPLSSTTPAAGSTFASGSVACTATAPSDMTTAVTNPVGYTCNNTSYLPSQPYSYQIVAKNNYNTAVSGFALTDDLTGKPFDLTKVTGSCSNGGTFSFASNVAKCTFPSAVAPTATVSMTVNVVIK